MADMPQADKGRSVASGHERYEHGIKLRDKRGARMKISPVLAAMLLAGSQAAHAHGIAGNRYFDGTLTFDDPAVADEAILPYYSYFAQPSLNAVPVVELALKNLDVDRRQGRQRACS